MIDEIDKMGADFRGDPASAMLEVLDPAQNDSFRDHYLDLEFDLSEVLFIATANVLDTIPGPLQDRMETIELAGYTLDDKKHIAERYLVPRQIKANGLKPSQIEFADPALIAIIEEYTREAGRPQPRAPDRHRLPQNRPRSRRGQGRLEGQGLGQARPRAARPPPRLRRERRRTKDPGVATGLAWTPTGGDVLFIEATAMPGSGGLTITGQLGDVMKESAQAALSYVRGHWQEIAPDLEEDWFAKHDIHVHVPAGAVPKDGPSAGVAMTVALSSLISGRPVSNEVAMTGEVTLTGQVLPIGGLKEKSLAAQRAGIKRVIVPARNEGDVEEIPERERWSSSSSTSTRSPKADRRRARPRDGGRGRSAGAPGSPHETIRSGRLALARLLDRRRALAARRRAALRDPRRPVLPPRRDRHRRPHPRRRLRRRDGRRQLQRVGAAALLRAGLGSGPSCSGPASSACARSRRWPGVATVPVAYLIGARAARPPRRDRRRGAGRGQPDAALVLAGGARLRALRPALRGLDPLLRARPRPRPAGATRSAGGSLSALALATHYFAIFPIAVEAIWLLRRRGRASAGRGLAIVALAGLALAPLALHQTSTGHAEWIADHALGHRVWETAATFLVGETGDIIARPESPLPALVPFAAGGGGAGPGLARGAAGRSGARPPIPLALAGAAVAIPLALAIVAPSKDYVLARNLMAALVPLLAAVAIGVTLRGARRAGVLVGAALFAYSLGFSVVGERLAVAAAARLGRGRRAPRRADQRRGRSSPGPWARRSLRHYLAGGSFQVFQSERYPVASPRDRLRLRRARRRRCRGGCSAPGFRQVGYGTVGALYVRRYALPGPDLAPPAAARRRAKPTSTSAATASSSTGSGRAGSATGIRCRDPDGYPGARSRC